MVSPDGNSLPCLTYDLLSLQWIYVLTRGSYRMLRSKQGWIGNQISFQGLMTMIGIVCDWRMTWTKAGDDKFGFINEEKLRDGPWSFIDEWRFRRKQARVH